MLEAVCDDWLLLLLLLVLYVLLLFDGWFFDEVEVDEAPWALPLVFPWVWDPDAEKDDGGGGGGGHGTEFAALLLFNTEFKLKFTKSCTLFMKPVKRSLNVPALLAALFAALVVLVLLLNSGWVWRCWVWGCWVFTLSYLLRLLTTSSARSRLSLHVLVDTLAVFKNERKCLSLSFIRSSVVVWRSIIDWQTTQMRSEFGLLFDECCGCCWCWAYTFLGLLTQNWQKDCLQKLHDFCEKNGKKNYFIDMKIRIYPVIYMQRIPVANTVSDFFSFFFFKHDYRLEASDIRFFY